MGKSTKYYQTHPEARKKKAKKDKEINARSEQKAKRRELERIRVAAKKRGANTSQTDYDHAVKRRVPKSVNRGRAEKSRVVGSKRKKK